MISILLLLSCAGTAPIEPIPELDLRSPLDPGQTRAGQVTDAKALFGGVSAEGAVGDFKLYNHLVRFVVQGDRAGNYYISEGGGVIDADVARPEDEPGRDAIDEFGLMVGLGRIMAPTAWELVNDGTDGRAAHVRVRGVGTPMTLLTGALESPDFVPDKQLSIVTDYKLPADTPLLEITTTITWEDEAAFVEVGDLAILADDVMHAWSPGRGFDNDADTDGSWIGAVGRRGEVALGLFSGDAPFSDGAAQTVLSEIGPVLTGFIGGNNLDNGDQITLRRYLGAGPDLATLSDAWHQAQGAATEEHTGVVLADGAPLAGAWVALVDDAGSPLTLARTLEDGTWSALAPVGLASAAVVSGRGPGIFYDLPQGAGWIGPYAPAPAASVSRRSLEHGAPGPAFARGHGLTEPIPTAEAAQVELPAPATVDLLIEDGGPGVVRVDRIDADPSPTDRRWVQGRPGGAHAWAYVADGAISLPLEPGTYRLTVHRGLRFETADVELELAAGDHVSAEVALTEVLAPAGLLSADPHSHAAPSMDSSIGMAPRLLTMAAHGVQVHFGTDHDNIADYRPLLAPLGLEAHMASVVAEEVSPVLRGHFNTYPVELGPGPNNGAPRWWENSWTTQELFDAIVDNSPDALIQANHPADGGSGLFSYANYDTQAGTIGSADHWSEDFTAMELINDGELDENLPFFIDLTNRGMMVTPVGVSDSHSHQGGVGENHTWLYLGPHVDGVADYSDVDMARAMRASHTVVSRGPLITAFSGGYWAVGETLSGQPTIDVRVEAPSWVQVDTIALWQDGEVVQEWSVEDPSATLKWSGSIALSGEEDTWYSVVASGSQDMQPVYAGVLPFAMTSAIRVDREDDGWTPPLPSLSVAR